MHAAAAAGRIKAGVPSCRLCTKLIVPRCASVYTRTLKRRAHARWNWNKAKTRFTAHVGAAWQKTFLFTISLRHIDGGIHSKLTNWTSNVGKPLVTSLVVTKPNLRRSSYVNSSPSSVVQRPSC